MKAIRPINTKGKDPIITTQFSSSHLGIDYAYPTGEPVYSASGKVIFAKGDEKRQWRVNDKNTDPFYMNGTRGLYMEDYGNYIIVDHGEGFTSLFGHLQYDSLEVVTGDTVQMGAQVAKVGSTGNSRGPHLHYELRQNGLQINPANYIDYTFTNYKEPGSPEPQPTENSNESEAHAVASWDNLLVYLKEIKLIKSAAREDNYFSTVRDSIQRFVEDFESNKGRASKWDDLVINHLKFKTSVNLSVVQVVAKCKEMYSECTIQLQDQRQKIVDLINSI